MVVRKMKEKCKDAARMRREKERIEFVELSKLLPLPSSTTSQLDKASIIRLTSSYLRMRAAFPQGLGEDWGTTATTSSSTTTNRTSPIASDQPSNQSYQSQRHNNGRFPQHHQQIRELGSLILQTLDGFVFALHRDGKIMYISETASVHLGLPQIDLTGSSIFEYIHPSDYNDINSLFNIADSDQLQLEANQSSQPTRELSRSFCMRMKCILPKRNAGLVSNGFKAIHCTGYLKVRCASSAGSNLANNSQQQLACCQKPLAGEPSSGRDWEGYALVAVGHSLLPTATTEVKLGASSFMFRASLDFKLYYIEASVDALLGHDQIDMIGQSLYQFIHVEDSNKLAEAHKLLINKGQVVTRYYRLMKRDGGYLWIETHATVINNPRSLPKPQHIVGICFVLGDDRHDRSRSVYHQTRQQIPTHQDPHQFRSTSALLADKIRAGGSHTEPSVSNKNKRRDTRDDISSKKCRKSTAVEPSQSFSIKPDKNNNYNQLISANNPTSADNSCYYHTIGATRRTSDDSCSIVSNVTSTSLSSQSSSSSSSNQHHLFTSEPTSHHSGNQVLLNRVSNNDGYLLTEVGVASEGEHVITAPNEQQYGAQDHLNPHISHQPAWLLSNSGRPIECNKTALYSPTQCFSGDPHGQTYIHHRLPPTSWQSQEQQMQSNNHGYYHRLDQQAIECDYQYDLNYSHCDGGSICYNPTSSLQPVSNYHHQTSCTVSHEY